MNIEVQDLSAVDKEVILKAPLSEISEQVDKKLREYRRQIQMPGFRPGQVPMGMVKKRFLKDVQAEEAARFVQETFEKEVATEHKPVGEAQLTAFDVKDEEISATFKIGVRPEFELTDISALSVDKMVHDVTDEEVADEFKKSLERASDWKETTQAAAEGMRVTADIVALNADGEVDEAETEKNQVLSLAADVEEDDMKPFRDAVIGKIAGEVAQLSVDDTNYRIDINKVEMKEEVEANEDFFTAQTGGEAKDEEAYKAWLKSKMQEYYDQQSEQNFHSAIVEALIEKHPLDVPAALQDTIANNYLQNLSQQMGGKLPDGFGIESIRQTSGDQILRDARWFFILEKLEDQFAEQVEIQAEDIDKYLETEAAKYQMTADQLRGFYASNTQQLDNLRATIREKKVFALLSEQVQENELSKEDFNKMMAEKEEAKKAAAAAKAEETKEA